MQVVLSPCIMLVGRVHQFNQINIDQKTEVVKKQKLKMSFSFPNKPRLATYSSVYLRVVPSRVEVLRGPFGGVQQHVYLEDCPLIFCVFLYLICWHFLSNPPHKKVSRQGALTNGIFGACRWVDEMVRHSWKEIWILRLIPWHGCTLPTSASIGTQTQIFRLRRAFHRHCPFLLSRAMVSLRHN